MKRPIYHSFAWAYDLIVPRPAGPPPEAVARLFEERGLSAGDSVVDAGCGTGAYSVPLAEAGFDVTGIDRSHDLIEEARAKGSEAAFVVGDLRDWAPPEPVRGVLCRGVLNDLLDDDDRDAAFANFARMLEAGGVLLLDVRDWDATVEHYTERPVFERTVETPDGRLAFRTVTSLDPERRGFSVHERFTLDRDGGPLVEDYILEQRCWTRAEIEERADRAGFAAVQVSGDEALGAREDRLVGIAIR